MSHKITRYVLVLIYKNRKAKKGEGECLNKEYPHVDFKITTRTHKCWHSDTRTHTHH